MTDLSPEAEALLEISRTGDDPTGRDRTRVRKALAGRIALGVATGAAVATISKSAATATAAATSASTATAGAAATTVTAAAAATTVVASSGVGVGAAVGSVGLSALGAKLLVTAAIVGAIGAGTVTYAKHRAEPRPSSEMPAKVEILAPARAVPQLPPRELSEKNRETTLEPASVVAAPVDPSIAAPASPRAVTGTTNAAASVPAKKVAADEPGANPSVAAEAPRASLADEIALIQDAHAALQSGAGGRALGILDEHARRFPNGTLSEERDASRVAVLCKLGRSDEARAEAVVFLRAHPRSPQAPAVRASCAIDEK